MAKHRTAFRVNEIADSALAIFSSRGFKNAQVAEIAQQAGVSSGSIYLYFEGKEALFSAAIMRAMGNDLPDHKFIAPPNDSLELFWSGFQIRQIYYDSLDRVDRLEIVIPLLWDEITRVSPAVRLIETCARDYPALAEAFYGRSRSGFVDRLANYLINAEKSGWVRKLPNPGVSARLIIETMAWFTMHRLGDHDGKMISAEDAKLTTVDALVHAFCSLQGKPTCP